MVIEMSLNSDIQKTFVQMILYFQKEINVICILFKFFLKTLVISFGQNLNKRWIFKVYIFILFKMKYLINKMQCNTLSQ